MPPHLNYLQDRINRAEYFTNAKNNWKCTKLTLSAINMNDSTKKSSLHQFKKYRAPLLSLLELWVGTKSKIKLLSIYKEILLKDHFSKLWPTARIDFIHHSNSFTKQKSQADRHSLCKINCRTDQFNSESTSPFLKA